jgi:hypothetical protein
MIFRVHFLLSFLLVKIEFYFIDFICVLVYIVEVQ